MTPERGAREERWRLSGRELVLIFSFWTLLALVSALGRYLGPRDGGLRVMSSAGPLALSFIEAWLWAAVTPLVFWLSSQLSVERPKWIARLPALLLAGLLIAFAMEVVLQFFRTELFPTPRRRAAPFIPLLGVGRFRLLNQFVLYLAVLAAGFAREYFVRDQRRQQEAMRLQQDAVRLQEQLTQARLDTLRMQLNPHFLFNTLHAISALVERDPGGVRRMIARLSELLRHTIDSRGGDQVPLREELAFLQRYVDIMEVRFQGKLRIEREIDPAVLEALVPSLILQPIVENALEHGASRSASEGRVEIRAWRESDMLRLSVRDNGPGLDDTRGRGEGGVGLANTRARLDQLFGEEAGVTLAPAPGGGVIAEIRLPFTTSADLRSQAFSAEDGFDG